MFGLKNWALLLAACALLSACSQLTRETSESGGSSGGLSAASGALGSTSRPGPVTAIKPPPAPSAVAMPPPPEVVFITQNARAVQSQALKFQPTEPPENKAKYVELWYGTNRKPSVPFDPRDPFTSERNQGLTYGMATVFIPKSHARGSTGSRLHVITGKDAPLTFEHAKVMTEGSYWDSLKSQLQSNEPSRKVVMVFIHGYNTDFQEAAIRTAQLWADLELQGVPSFFSWPSKGSMGAYTVDEATIDFSEKYLEQYLVTLRGQVGKEQPIHVIAHSMGNRALLRVAARLQNSINLGQIILAAPDVDSDLFQQLAHAYPRISERTTLYVSTSDKPVNFSGFFHDVERVGAPPRFAQIAGIDTVEVKAKTGLLDLGHSYFAEYKDLLDEIALLITTNPHASKLFVGKREDRRVKCNADDSGRTKESCWRIVTSK